MSRLERARSQRVAVELDRVKLQRRLPQASRCGGGPCSIPSVCSPSPACVGSGRSFARASILVCRLQVSESAVEPSRRIYELEESVRALRRREEVVQPATIASQWAKEDTPLEGVLRALQDEVEHRLFACTAPRASLRVRSPNCVEVMVQRGMSCAQLDQ